MLAKVIFDARYTEALKNYGDGELNVEEILSIHNDSTRRQEQNALLQKIVLSALFYNSGVDVVAAD